MDVGIDAAGGDYLTFGGNNLRRRANGDSDVRLDIGITRFADCDNTPLFDTNVGFDDPPVIDDQRIGQHQIDTVVSEHLSLAHTVTDDLPAAELDLFAVGGQIVFDLDPQFGVRQAHFIAGGGAKHVGIGLT